jgi:hypothetical protein
MLHLGVYRCTAASTSRGTPPRPSSDASPRYVHACAYPSSHSARSAVTPRCASSGRRLRSRTPSRSTHEGALNLRPGSPLAFAASFSFRITPRSRSQAASSIARRLGVAFELRPPLPCPSISHAASQAPGRPSAQAASAWPGAIGASAMYRAKLSSRTSVRPAEAHPPRNSGATTESARARARLDPGEQRSWCMTRRGYATRSDAGQRARNARLSAQSPPPPSRSYSPSSSRTPDHPWAVPCEEITTATSRPRS